LLNKLLKCLFLKPKQDEIESDGGQVEPPGINMIYLPYANDIRDIDEARKNCFWKATWFQRY